MKGDLQMRSYTKRLFALAGSLSVILFLIFDQRIPILVGVLLGAFLSWHKMRLYRQVMMGMAALENQGTGSKFLYSLIYVMLPFITLFAAVMIDQWLFFGVAVGLLCNVSVILINIITERAGLSHNEWSNWF
jgi:hypothetical protein